MEKNWASGRESRKTNYLKIKSKCFDSAWKKFKYFIDPYWRWTNYKNKCINSTHGFNCYYQLFSQFQ